MIDGWKDDMEALKRDTEEARREKLNKDLPKDIKMSKTRWYVTEGEDDDVL